MTTTLYRFYDADGVLLYVGITKRGADRWDEHGAEKSWWADVASVTVEHHDSRATARDAEAEAIRAEEPVHNIADNPLRKVTAWTGLQWTCDECGRDANSGWVQSSGDLFKIAKAHKQGDYTAIATWSIRCTDHAHPFAPYDFAAADCRTIEDAVEWDRHIEAKDFGWCTDWRWFIRNRPSWSDNPFHCLSRSWWAPAEPPANPDAPMKVHTAREMAKWDFGDGSGQAGAVERAEMVAGRADYGWRVWSQPRDLSVLWPDLDLP